MDTTNPLPGFSNDVLNLYFEGLNITRMAKELGNPHAAIQCNTLLRERYTPRPVTKPKVIAFTGTWCGRLCGGIITEHGTIRFWAANGESINTTIENPNLKIDNPPQPPEETVEVKDCDRELYRSLHQDYSRDEHCIQAIAEFRQQAERGEFL